MDNLIFENYSTAACKKDINCTTILCEYTSSEPPWTIEVFSIRFYPCLVPITINIYSNSSEVGTILNLNLTSSYVIQPLGHNFGKYEIILDETREGVLFGVSSFIKAAHANTIY